MLCVVAVPVRWTSECVHMCLCHGNRLQETEEQCRVWVVLPTGDGTVVEIAFFSSSSCTERPLKPIRLSAQPKRGQGLFRVSGDPKHTHMFFVKNKEKKVKFIAESQ